MSPRHVPRCSPNSGSFLMATAPRGSQAPQRPPLNTYKDLLMQLDRRHHDQERHSRLGCTRHWRGPGAHCTHNKEGSMETGNLPSMLTVQPSTGVRSLLGVRTEHSGGVSPPRVLLNRLHFSNEQGSGFLQELLPAHGAAELPLLQRPVHGQGQPVRSQPGTSL